MISEFGADQRSPLSREAALDPLYQIGYQAQESDARGSVEGYNPGVVHFLSPWRYMQLGSCYSGEEDTQHTINILRQYLRTFF